MLGDLWSLAVSENSSSGAWSELDPDGKAPHVRCSQAVAPVGNDIFFLGGSYYKCVRMDSHVELPFGGCSAVVVLCGIDWDLCASRLLPVTGLQCGNGDAYIFKGSAWHFNHLTD